jgi:hypothetical protein
MLQVLVTAKVPGSLILVTLMMEAPHSSETFVFTKSTRRDISEEGILHSHTVKTSNFIALTGLAL